MRKNQYRPSHNYQIFVHSTKNRDVFTLFALSRKNNKNTRNGPASGARRAVDNIVRGSAIFHRRATGLPFHGQLRTS